MSVAGHPPDRPAPSPRTPPFPLSAKRQNGAELGVAIPNELVEAFAERVGDLLAERLPNRPEPWLGVKQAAEYLACPRSRIYELVAEGRLPCVKDGRRSLFRREWLDGVLSDDSP